MLPGPAILFLGMYHEEIIRKVCKDMCTKILIAVFLLQQKVESNIILHQQATGSIKQGTSTASNKTMKWLYFLTMQRFYDKVWSEKKQVSKHVAAEAITLCMCMCVCVRACMCVRSLICGREGGGLKEKHQNGIGLISEWLGFHFLPDISLHHWIHLMWYTFYISSLITSLLCSKPCNCFPPYLE